MQAKEFALSGDRGGKGEGRFSNWWLSFCLCECVCVCGGDPKMLNTNQLLSISEIKGAVGFSACDGGFFGSWRFGSCFLCFLGQLQVECVLRIGDPGLLRAVPFLSEVTASLTTETWVVVDGK
mmetsp:Transcript_40743/g.96876  ORF Transcript_40743/g.96876 Transcript_40743/m.96876 type:complete len:123 (+) Transcript_40743:671-1039(+)